MGKRAILRIKDKDGNEFIVNGEIQPVEPTVPLIPKAIIDGKLMAGPVNVNIRRMERQVEDGEAFADVIKNVAHYVEHHASETEIPPEGILACLAGWFAQRNQTPSKNIKSAVKEGRILYEQVKEL